MHNTLLIDNTDKRYHSCAEAYNKEILKHSEQLEDILIFVHQDIAFDNDKLQQRIVGELNDNANQILGVAGMPYTGKTISNLKYRGTGEYITATQLEEKTEVESIDECCFAMTKELFLKLMFDEHICSHWHLYAVNLCYEARQRFNTKSYVLPDSIYHKVEGGSGLTVDRHFLHTIWKMSRKYRHDFSTIYTPCYIISTRMPKAVLKIIKTTVKNLMHKRIS